MEMNVKTAMIKRWAMERGINQNDSTTQAFQLGKKYIELCEGVGTRDKEQITNSIGSFYVGLTFLCMQEGLDMEKCIEHGYAELKENDMVGEAVEGL